MTRTRALRFVPIEAVSSASGPCIALVPGEAVPLLRLELPEGLRGGARDRVARRQAADRLGLAPDALDVRPLARNGSVVLVVDPGEAEAWRQAVQGTACAAVLPDYLALEAAPEVWVLDVGEGRVLARLGTDDGFAAEIPLARLQLVRAFAAAPPSAVLRTGVPAPEIDAFLDEAGVPVFATPEELAAAGHPRPVASDWEGTAADLLQSSDAAVEQLRARIRRWRVPALLGALALALWVADMMVRIDRTRDAQAALAAATTALVRERFVPNGPLLDIRAQVSRRAAELAGNASDADDASPLAVLRRSAPALQASDVQLRTVTWRAGTGMETAVAADDFATVEVLARRLGEDGVAAEVTDALADGSGGVLARLRLGEP